MYTPISLKIKNIISIIDVFYEFKNNKAIIVTGRNYDNPSQKSNGVGKSALIESLALAFTGTSIRDVKVKELINRQAKDGEVELILHNSITKRDMKIWRKIYSGTKSAECRIWLGEEEVRLPDINTYNKFVFDEMGLSKEDFFNFYLLVQANYSPFLRVGDTKKKEIINRFSGADRVDSVIPYVKSDCELIHPQIEQLNKQLVEETTKEQLYQENIDLLNQKRETLDQDKKDKIAQFEQQKTQINQQIGEKDQLMKVEQDKIKTQQKTQQDLNLDVELKKINDQVEKINQEKNNIVLTNTNLQDSIRNVQNSFSGEINQIKIEEKQLNDQIAQLKKDKSEFEQLESDITKQLQDSIECPSCHHVFSFRNQEFNVSEAQAQLPIIKEEIDSMSKQLVDLENQISTDLANKKKAINEKIIVKQDEIREKVTANNEKVTQLSNSLTQLNSGKTALQANYNQITQAIQSSNSAIQALEQQKQSLSSQITSINEQIESTKKYTVDEEIKQYEEKKQTSKTHQDEIKKSLDEVNKQYQQTASWEINFKNFKSFVANQSIKNIEDYTNLFLNQMGSDLAISLDGFSTLASGKIKEQISVNVLRGGFNEGSYGAFSGGERGRIDICVILAIQQLINLNCTSGGLDLLICDEILDQIDTLGLESIINSLQNLDRTIMIVSQNEINALKDHTLLIEKRNKVSKFVN